MQVRSQERADVHVPGGARQLATQGYAR